jgi:phage terminase large subunit-like protein
MRLGKFQKEWIAETLEPGVRASALMLGRGNGKSTLLAGLALHALYDPPREGGEPQIPVVAVTLNQATRAVFGVARRMIEREPELARRATFYSAIGASRVETPFNGGEMFPVSADVDGLQGLDPSFAVCDEIGFVPVESWDSLLLASGKRPSSVVCGIGTPGFDRQNALWHLRQRAREGDLPDGFRFVEYSADDGCDIEDETQWRKANPALSEGFMDVDALRIAVRLSPEVTFRIFRLAQFVDGVDSWLGQDAWAVWESLADPWPMEAGAPTWVGTDVALRHDSTAVAWCQRRDDGRLHVTAKVWLPRDDGRLDVTDAMQHLRGLCGLYDVKAISYDPRLFELAAQQLADEGFPLVEVPQSVERMTPAVGATYEAIRRGELSHDGDDTFGAQVLAAVARFNPNGFTLEKRKSRDRIDAAVAMVLALNEARRPEPPKTELMAAWV